MKININKSIYPIAIFSFMVLITFWSCNEDDGNTIIESRANKLTITDVQPREGSSGQNVTITGTNFSPNISENIVLFTNNVAAEIVSASESTIVAIVPTCAFEGAVSVTTRNEEAPGPIFSISPQPSVDSVAPSSGVPFDVITINGFNFSTVLSENVVTIAGINAQVLSASCNEISVIIPSNTPVGTQEVEVTTQGVSTTFPNFTISSYTQQAIQINSPSDDAEEAQDGFMLLTSSDLDFGKFDEFAPSGNPQGVQKFGIRFNNVQIPQGATVSYCAVQFEAARAGSMPTQITFYGHDVANSPTFNTTALDISNRAKTNSSIAWDIPAWGSGGDRGMAQRSINLASIVQEIVNNPDWVPGNSISFLIEQTGPSAAPTNTTGGRDAETFFGGQAEITTVHF